MNLLEDGEELGIESREINRYALIFTLIKIKGGLGFSFEQLCCYDTTACKWEKGLGALTYFRLLLPKSWARRGPLGRPKRRSFCLFVSPPHPFRFMLAG